MKYYTKSSEAAPFYDEYLLNLDNSHRSYLSNLGLPDGAAFSVWRYKEDSNRNGTATDTTVTVNHLVEDRLNPQGQIPEIELTQDIRLSLTQQYHLMISKRILRL